MTLHSTTQARKWIAVIPFVAVVSGCELEDAGQPIVDPDVDTDASDIYGGSALTGYPETVLIDVLKSDGKWGKFCTGVAVAPSVVLTVAHCFTGYSRWRVFVPGTGQTIETSHKLAHPTYASSSKGIGPDTGYDAGLLFLPAKISVSRLPHLTSLFTSSADTVRAIGRVSGGVLSADKVYVSTGKKLTDVVWAPSPKYYLFSEPVLEVGDSGGPVIRLDPTRHTVVGINAGGDTTGSVATRVDAIHEWITGQIQSYTAGRPALAPSCGSGLTCSGSRTTGALPCVANNQLVYCCDTPGQAITSGACAGEPQEPPGTVGPGFPPTSGSGITMWDVAGHVRDHNLAPVPGVVVQVWGFGAAGNWKHYDSVTDAFGNFKVGGFIVKGGTYEVRLARNEARLGFGAYRYPAFTSWLSHTRNQSTSRDTPLGSTAYLNQKAGSDDCAGPDTTRSGNKRCDFMYTSDANPGRVYPPAPRGLRVTCDPSDPSKPRATIAWNAEPRATLGYYVRVDHRPSSFDVTACTGGAGSIGSVDRFDRCVDLTTHTSLTVGPIVRGAPYLAWLHSANVEGAIAMPPSSFTFTCP